MKKVKILINGKIYTEDTRKPWAEAVVIEGKNFVCVGTNEEVIQYAKFNSDEYETVDLEGKTVLPGLIEGHSHAAIISKSAWVIFGEETHDREKLYETEHVRVRTVKFFGDGSNEAGDVLSLIPFANDPEGKNYGDCNFTFEGMRDVLVRLNKERLDLHVHIVCDGTLRRMLDAIEAAQKICGDGCCIKVALAHLEIMDPEDAKRFKKLGVCADITPQWFGSVAPATQMLLGE